MRFYVSFSRRVSVTSSHNLSCNLAVCKAVLLKKKTSGTLGTARVDPLDQRLLRGKRYVQATMYSDL